MKLPRPIRGGKDRKGRKAVATGVTASMVLASLLGGLALVVFSLRDVHLRVELTRHAGDQEA